VNFKAFMHMSEVPWTVVHVQLVVLVMLLR